MAAPAHPSGSASSSAIAIGGDDPAVVHRLAERFGLIELTADPDTGAAAAWDAGRPCIAVPGAIDNRAVSDALHPPFSACVEAGPDTDPETLAETFERRALPTLAAGGLFCSMTTAEAYRIDLAPVFLGALSGWEVLDADHARALELAVHEALANAMLHGNLEIDGELRESVSGFFRFTETLTERIEDPRFGGRRLDVGAVWDEASLTVSVHDQGSGHAQDGARPEATKTGRGLTLIQDAATEVELTDGGRTIRMSFAR